MKFVVLQHIQPSNQVPFPRRRYLQMMAEAADKVTDKDQPKGQDVHFDLMLETDEGLRTWAMGLLPTAGKSCGAIELPLHRADYLTHEGPVSDGRGTVKRVMQGSYNFANPQQVLLQMKKQDLIIEMDEIQPAHFQFSFVSVDKED